MDSLQTFVLLMFSAAILVGVAQKLQIAYPIALIVCGTAIGFIPGLQVINFDPNLILVIVLPPILYYGAFGIPFREFKHYWKDIFSLALGLVVVTTLVIGIIFKWIFPEFPWALAFAFGAIVSPPDAIAATTILKRFAIGQRLLTELEGESLINDASALVLYRLAIAALLTGVFSFAEGSFEFVKIASGGIAIGVILGLLLQGFSKRYLDPVVGVVFSFSIPYVTYVLADSLGVSGVLAVVTNGLIGSRFLLKHQAALRRVLGYAFWDIFIILMNCFVFILIGLELKAISAEMTLEEMALYTGYGLLMTFAMIVVRMIWVYAKSCFSYLKALKEPNASKLCPQIIRESAIIGWSGMRGIVSLAAALAIPLTLPNGMPLQGRNEVIFITFVVILITLLLPGLTLPSLIRRLKIHRVSDHEGATRVRKKLAKVTEEFIDRLHILNSINQEEYVFLQEYFTLQRKVLEISTSTEKKLQNTELARLKIIKVQREHLVKMWKRFEIDDKLLNHLELELDMLETHVARAILK